MKFFLISIFIALKVNELIMDLETKKKGRIEFPIDSLRSFRIESSKGRLQEGDSSILNPAIIILSQFLP